MAIYTLALLFTANHSRAEAIDLRQLNVQIVIEEYNETNTAIVRDLSKRIPAARIVSLSDKTEIKASKSSIIITVGPSALRSYLEKSREGNIISTFTSSQAFRAILDSIPDRPSSLSAIFSEPSPISQFQLISLLYKKPVIVEALLSDKTRYLEPILERAAAQTGNELSIEYITAGSNINQTLSQIPETSVLIGLPDNSIFNVANARIIIMSTYRKNQGLIGFSAALVKAGALATTYSSIAEIDEQVVEVLSAYLSTGKLPDPQFPKYFRSVVNEDVARSLNLVVDEQVRNFSNKSLVIPK